MLDIAPIAPSLPAKPLTVTRTGKVFATSQNPTRGEAAILEFVNSDLAPELSRQRAVPLLKSKNLLRDVRGLTLEGRARFVDKVDEVGRSGLIFSLFKSYFHRFCEGISNHRPADCEIRNRLGKCVWYNRATSTLSRALRRA